MPNWSNKFKKNRRMDTKEILEEVKALIPDEIKDKVIDNLEGFKKAGKIGKGAYGFVYKIERLSDSAIFAAKFSTRRIMPHKNEEMYYDKAKYFRIEEFILSAKLNYPSLLGLVSFCPFDFDGDNFPTIILPLIPNGNVDDFFDSENRTNTRAYIILLGTAIGMRHLQSIGIAHRDLKPVNVLLDKDFYPIIADFGCSKSIHDGILETETGTPIYLAPEVAEGSYGLEVDVYSFAIMAYRLLTMEIPYKDIKFTHFQVVNGLRPDTSRIQYPFVVEFLKKCWDGNPTERLTFDQIIDQMTDQIFIDCYNPDIGSILKYLNLYGDEFNYFKEKLKRNNPGYKPNDEEESSCSSEYYENALGLSSDEVDDVLRIIKVNEDVFNHWAETYQPNPNADQEKRALQIEFMMNEIGCSRKIIEIAYDFLISKYSLDDVQLMFITSLFSTDIKD